MLDKGARDIITGGLVILIFSAGLWAGSTINTAHAERDRQTAINNAIAYCGEPNDCNTAQALATLQGMSNNGYKLAKHGLCWATAPEDIPQ